MKRVCIYLYEGKILLPTIGIRAGGTFLITDPVAIFKVGEREDLVATIARRLSEPIPRVDVIDDSMLDRKPPVSRAAKARSWKAFVKAAKLWILRDGKDDLVLKATHPVYEFRELQEDDQPIRVWPGGTDAAMVGKETVDVILQSEHAA